jgi:hypothetical protein
VFADDYTTNQYDDRRDLYKVGNRGSYSRGADRRRK